MHRETFARFIVCTIHFLFMELRICLGIVGIMAFLFCSVSAAGISLNDVISGGSSDAGISVPQLPPPEGGSVLQRKVLDSQPQFYKSSTRLLHEAEISRDLANKEWEAEMVKYTEKMNKETGKHYTVEYMKSLWMSSPDPLYTPEMVNALENYQFANKKYNAALAATGEKDYEDKARIFESAASMYAVMGATKYQEQTENAALAARAQAAAQKISLPLSLWIAVFGIIGGLILVQRKRN
jgi:hypothetical protein